MLDRPGYSLNSTLFLVVVCWPYRSGRQYWLKLSCALATHHMNPVTTAVLKRP